MPSLEYPAINVVWLKRDLRLSDHEPLFLAAEQRLPTLLLYIFEPMLLEDKHYSERHWRFVTQSLIDMNRALSPLGHKVSVAHGNALEVFQRIAEEYQIKQIFSHEEIGLANTFARDKAIKAWARKENIRWTESSFGAVIRGCKSREHWDKHWNKVMRAPVIENDLASLVPLKMEFDCTALPRQWADIDSKKQIGGEQQAWKTLNDFFDERGKNYHYLISKPQQSQESCSRMSPYLAWGNISLRQMYQQLLSHWQRPGWRRALSALSSRVHWHCHFMQKFESECRMEFSPINQGYDDFTYRIAADCAADLEAWKTGNTGYPLVDACMRCLKETGYINFRMRAMLVSFLCHHLNIDWRLGAEHLARVFLDFEPGIHYPQFQMQAGVTGINTIRIYNPTKQAKEQDANGEFIRTWCPELGRLPDELLFEPWQLSPMDEVLYEFQLGTDYPEPIIDLTKSYSAARDRLWKWKSRPDVKAEAQRILRIHVRPSS